METRTLQAGSEDAGGRLDAWLAGQLPDVTRSAAARLCEEGRVTLAGKPLAKNYRLTGGETVAVTLPDPAPVDVAPQDIPLDVVYEDGDVIVVNKPKGLVVHPAPGHPDGTLVNALLHHCGSRRKTTLPTSVWHPSSRTTPWPASTGASWRGISGRTAARWTPPSAATRWTGRRWRWWRTAAAR